METWTCDSCGEKRPDDKIDVFTFPIKGLLGAERNWRYCNDRDKCFDKAKEKAKTGKI